MQTKASLCLKKVADVTYVASNLVSKSETSPHHMVLSLTVFDCLIGVYFWVSHIMGWCESFGLPSPKVRHISATLQFCVIVLK